MKLFSFFRNGRKRPAWQYTASGMIWRILFSESGKIAGEDRDQKTKSVSFFCLEESSGRVLWEKLQMEEQWWIGMESTHKNILFLHEYEKPDFPTHLRISAIDLETGKVLWRNPELQFLFAAEGEVYACKDLFEKRIFFELDACTGQIVQEFGDDETVVNAKRMLFRSGQINGAFDFPMEHQESDDDDVNEVLTRTIDQRKLVGQPEWIRKDNLLLFNYHQLTNERRGEQALLDNCFKIVDLKKGAVVFSEILNKNVVNAVPDAFFVKDDAVYFIKEKITLTAIRLSGKEKN